MLARHSAYWRTVSHRRELTPHFTVLLCGLALGLVLMASVGFAVGPDRDAGVFIAVGEQIVRGGVPYRDVWDHKPPGIYLVAALASIFPGSTWHVLIGLSVASAISAGLAILTLAGWWAAVLGMATLMIPTVAFGGGLTETFAAAPAAFALSCAQRGRWLAAGMLTAVAMTFSLQLIAIIPALIYLGAYRLRAVASCLAGAAVAAFPIAAWLGLTGAVPAAWDQLVVYQSAYLRLDRTADLIREGRAFLLSLTPLGFLAAIAGRPRKNVEWAAVAWLTCALLLVLLGGRLFSHYAGFIVAPLAIVAGQGAERLRQINSCLLLAVLVGIVGLGFIGFHDERPVGPSSERVGLAVRGRTDPDARILVWGFEAWTYSVAERAPAGRYVYLMPLTTPGYTTPEMIETWVAELAARPPDLIVDAEAANPRWSEGQDFFRPPPPGAAGGRELDLLEPLRRFVSANYELAFEVVGRKVYILR